MATNVAAKKVKKKKEVKTLSLQEFLGDNATVVVKQTKLNWADETENITDDEPSITFNRPSLPTAPRAARAGNINLSKIPAEGPFTAYVGGLPFDVSNEEITKFFGNSKVMNIRIPKDQAGRTRGFAYVEFESRQMLIDALSLNDTNLKNKSIKVDLVDQNQDGEGRWDGGHHKNQDDGEDKTLGDWRKKDSSAAASSNKYQTKSYSSDKRYEVDRNQDNNSDRYASKNRSDKFESTDGGYNRSNFNDRSKDSTNKYGSLGRKFENRDDRSKQGNYGDRYDGESRTGRNPSDDDSWRKKDSTSSRDNQSGYQPPMENYGRRDNLRESNNRGFRDDRRDNSREGFRDRPRDTYRNDRDGYKDRPNDRDSYRDRPNDRSSYQPNDKNSRENSNLDRTDIDDYSRKNSEGITSRNVDGGSSSREDGKENFREPENVKEKDGKEELSERQVRLKDDKRDYERKDDSETDEKLRYEKPKGWRQHDGDKEEWSRVKEQPPEDNKPKERPKLILKPRSKPLEDNEQPTATSSSIFGGAKPVDTTQREREIESKIKHTRTDDFHRDDIPKRSIVSRKESTEKMKDQPISLYPQRTSVSSDSRSNVESVKSCDQDDLLLEKSAPAKMIPAPPPKENIWEMRKTNNQNSVKSSSTGDNGRTFSDSNSDDSKSARNETNKETIEKSDRSVTDSKSSNEGSKTNSDDGRVPDGVRAATQSLPPQNVWNKRKEQFNKQADEGKQSVVSTKNVTKIDDTRIKSDGKKRFDQGKLESQKVAVGVKQKSRERPLPTSIDEMPKLEDKNKKDWQNINKFSSLMDEEGGDEMEDGDVDSLNADDDAKNVIIVPTETVLEVDDATDKHILTR